MSGPYLLFDCDGTLVDSERIAMATMHETARSIGLTLSPEDCNRLFLGHTRQHCLHVLEQHFGGPLPASFASDLVSAIRRGLEADLQPVPGVVAMLKRLPQIKCIVSNGSWEHVAFVLNKTGLATLFTGRCYTATQFCQPKPSPMLYLQAMVSLGIDPRQCIAIEDSATGVQAAATAGICTLGFAMLAHHNQLLRAGACATFGDMLELPDLIAKIDARRRGCSRVGGIASGKLRRGGSVLHVTNPESSAAANDRVSDRCGA
jgi:HAD superfamily hydrolase (TIGR01509 family)